MIRTLAKALAVPAFAVALLVAIAVLRFVFPDTSGIMLLSVVPIATLGSTLGIRGGLAAAAFATAAFLAWVAGPGSSGVVEDIDHPLVFFLLGFVSGTWAHGALGTYDLAAIAANQRLREAIAAGDIVMYYQPIVRARGGEVVALEALARWRNPTGGIISPLEFIPDAERDPETIWELTLHTLEVVARDLSGWVRHGDFQITVNVSPAVLRRTDLAEIIAEVQRRHELPRGRLGVEVTERAVAGADPGPLAALVAFGEAGLGTIAIDDFGVGQSSLARLDRLPVDTLKIDQELIRRASREPTRAIVEGIVRMASGLGMTVIAEGVEDPATLELLAELDCDAIQGFVVSRPLPPDEVADWLTRGAPQPSRPR